MAQLNDLLVMGQSTLLGPIAVKNLITQGNPSNSSTISSMNRFETDIFVSGNGSAPNSPTIAGFYLGKSSGDDNRHMDIVSGGDVAYIDFNKNTYGIDYSARLFVNVTTGATSWEWLDNSNITSKIFNVKGTLQQSGVNVVDLSSSQALTNKTYNGYTLGAACAKSYTDSTSASAISTGTSLVTERDVYYGLPSINGAHTYTSNTTIYAPTSAGTSGYILKSSGSGAPTWLQKLPVANGGTGATALTANRLLYVSGTGTSAAMIASSSIYVDDATIRPTSNSSCLLGTSDYSWYGIYATAFCATSDVRKKKDLVTYHCEQDICSLPLYRFKYLNDASEQEHIGCIAQDLQQICPDLILTDDQGYLAVKENKLVYVLLDKMKTMQNEINMLKEQINGSRFNTITK